MSRGLISFTFGFVGDPTSVVKLRGKRKKNSDSRFIQMAYISTTCKIEMDFFSQLRKSRRVVFT